MSSVEKAGTVVAGREKFSRWAAAHSTTDKAEIFEIRDQQHPGTYKWFVHGWLIASASHDKGVQHIGDNHVKMEVRLFVTVSGRLVCHVDYYENVSVQGETEVRPTLTEVGAFDSESELMICHKGAGGALPRAVQDAVYDAPKLCPVFDPTIGQNQNTHWLG